MLRGRLGEFYNAILIRRKWISSGMQQTKNFISGVLDKEFVAVDWYRSHASEKSWGENITVRNTKGIGNKRRSGGIVTGKLLSIAEIISREGNKERFAN